MANVQVDETAVRSVWPQTLAEEDDLYSVTNLETGKVEYLVYSSSETNSMYVRDNGSWWQVSGTLVLDFDDPKYSIEFVDVDYISEYDALEQAGGTAVTAAVPKQACPPATSDIALNLKNRKRAIDVANYMAELVGSAFQAGWFIKASLRA